MISQQLSLIDQTIPRSSQPRARNPSSKSRFVYENKTPSRLLALIPRKEHGGSVRCGKRKLARPFNTKKPLHLAFRSERAKGTWSFKQFKHSEMIEQMLRKLAKKYDIRILQYANAGNHLHLLIQAKSRIGFKKFTRTFAGLIARKITGARKGKAVGRFWDLGGFFSRVTEWGRDALATKNYVVQNMLEADGVISYKVRSEKKRRFRPDVKSNRLNQSVIGIKKRTKP